MEDELRAWYLEHRRALEEASTDQISRFETAVLTASGAGVGGIFYLIVQPTSDAHPAPLWAIVSAISFSMSFFLVLISNLTSHSDMEREIKKFDYAYRSGNFESIGSNSWGKITSLLNWLSPILLLFGGLSAFFLLRNGVT
jgi:hypothetical protein